MTHPFDSLHSVIRHRKNFGTVRWRASDLLESHNAEAQALARQKGLTTHVRIKSFLDTIEVTLQESMIAAGWAVILQELSDLPDWTTP